MAFYHLLKKLVHIQLKLLKAWAISVVKILLIVLKTASKRARQTTAEATGDLIGNKIADKITSISKSPKEFHRQNASKELHSKTKENEIEIQKKDIYLQKKRQQIIDELRFI